MYILGIHEGHNSGICLLKNGRIVFSIEEERLSRKKWDDGPFASICKLKEFTNKIDCIAFSSVPDKFENLPIFNFTGESVYLSFLRKLGLINYDTLIFKDYSLKHHICHAALAFYRSNFTDAAAVIVDGSGSSDYVFENNIKFLVSEVESIYQCSYPHNFNPLFKKLNSLDHTCTIHHEKTSDYPEIIISNHAGIGQTYNAITRYCNFEQLENGKLMGLSSYGKPNSNLPNFFEWFSNFYNSNRNAIKSQRYPNSLGLEGGTGDWVFDSANYKTFDKQPYEEKRKDIAYHAQQETQKQVLHLLLKANEYSGSNNIVLSGGYALNCQANYFYLEELNKRNINLYVEPICNDGGISIGAALLAHYEMAQSYEKQPQEIFLGPPTCYTEKHISNLVARYDVIIEESNDDTIVRLLCDKNIVALFQGRSENGPRALGNRSLIFDPRFKDGKDFVNTIKRREWFRPFAGSILEEHVHKWFDMRGIKNSPVMMYAVKCLPGVEEIIPSIIHVDNTCRIQTVNETENKNFYNLINCFYEKTGVPILFNTSFNLAGDPLVETLDDAFKTLSLSEIEYLYLPEYKKLITFKNMNKKGLTR